LDSVDPDKRRALSNFYREEFLSHLVVLEASGVLTDGCQEVVDRTYRRLLHDLDSVCCHADFPSLAEKLLRHFETLTRLSAVQRRRLH
jgi:hypothetical protein